MSVETALSLAELGRIVLADTPLEEVLGRVAALARDTIPRAVEVSVTLLINDRPTTAAFTGEPALELDERQYAQGYGPCLDAARGGEVMKVEDMATETRWPDYAPIAHARGISSSLSMPLPIQEHIVGALNVYGAVPNALDDEAVALGALFADYAAVAVSNAHVFSETAGLAEGMRSAMATRAVIEQAKGILIALHGCTAEEAFNRLTQVSQNSNRKLRDVAAGVVTQAQRR